MRTRENLMHAALAAAFVLGLAAAPAAFAADDKMNDQSGMSDTSMDHNKKSGTGMKDEMKSGGMSSHSDMSKHPMGSTNEKTSKDTMSNDKMKNGQ